MKKTAWLNLRYTSDKRARLFENGLRRHGFNPVHSLTTTPRKGDIFVTWNRIGQGILIAKIFEKKGLPVLVAENATFGNSFAGDSWYTIARKYHNTRGCFTVGDPSRWDDLAVDFHGWREAGETIILPSRGIGSDPVKMPPGFARMALKNHGGRVRAHPGRREGKTLEEDLAGAGRVITWGSGAAIKALIMGIPVISYYPQWIGRQDNTDAGRLSMFRELIWAQWRHSEIESGYAFDLLLN